MWVMIVYFRGFNWPMILRSMILAFCTWSELVKNTFYAIMHLVCCLRTHAIRVCVIDINVFSLKCTIIIRIGQTIATIFRMPNFHVSIALGFLEI